MKHFLRRIRSCSLILVKCCSCGLFFSTLSMFDDAAIIASAGVTVGLERYLCLNNTFVLILVSLVSFDHTFQHL